MVHGGPHAPKCPWWLLGSPLPQWKGHGTLGWDRPGLPPGRAGTQLEVISSSPTSSLELGAGGKAGGGRGADAEGWAGQGLCLIPTPRGTPGPRGLVPCGVCGPQVEAPAGQGMGHRNPGVTLALMAAG